LASECGVDSFELDSDAWSRIETHEWPGNVRELLLALRRMVADSDGATALGRFEIEEALRGIRADFKPRAQFDARDRDRLQASLNAAGWNVSATARALGMSRGALRHRMRTLGLE
jgi:two-component system response regulator AtoC